MPQPFFAAPGRRAVGLADLLQREHRQLPRRKVVANPVLLVDRRAPRPRSGGGLRRSGCAASRTRIRRTRAAPATPPPPPRTSAPGGIADPAGTAPPHAPRLSLTPPPADSNAPPGSRRRRARRRGPAPAPHSQSRQASTPSSARRTARAVTAARDTRSSRLCSSTGSRGRGSPVRRKWKKRRGISIRRAHLPHGARRTASAPASTAGTRHRPIRLVPKRAASRGDGPGAACRNAGSRRAAAPCDGRPSASPSSERRTSCRCSSRSDRRPRNTPRPRQAAPVRQHGW